MQKTYTAKSNAKINVGLRILSKRKDGYHNLETIFYPVKLYDTIKVAIRKPDKGKTKILVITSDKNLENENNICFKAAKLFLEIFRIKSPYEIKISITKRIPVGGGLGGGSSNAAIVLKILAKHFHTNTLHTRLSTLALALGSDVPFFLLNKPAYATSRGEKLKPLPYFKIKDKILIVNPGIHISTDWAFKQLQIADCRLQIMENANTFSSNTKYFINDFEKVVFKKHPKIKSIKKDMLKLGAKFALMSGSGSTVYGVFNSGKNYNIVLQYFSRKKYFVSGC